MLELEKLKNKYIKYSEEITEDTFNKILDRAKEFAKEICPDLKTYRSFNDHSFDSFRLNEFFRFSGSSCSYGVDNNRQDAEEIKVSDIIGEETKFEIGDYVVSLIDTPYGRKKGDLLLITEEDSYRIVATHRKEFFNGTITNGEVAESLRKATQEEIALVVKPKSKEFDRNWYVKVDSQEEADLVFDWLRAQGEPVIDADRMLEFRVNIDKYITYWKEGNSWIVNNNSAKNAYQKQLSDILPNYSKVNRNVYYEVEDQEQYLEILDWLESNGEKVDRGFCVNNAWNFVYYHKVSKDWYLGGVNPNLPKAEFQFKGKSEKQPIMVGMGLREQILRNPYLFDSVSFRWEMQSHSSTQNSITELNQESTKLLSFEEDDVVLFKTNSVKISNEQLIIND
jgi:hypothetical protein